MVLSRRELALGHVHNTKVNLSEVFARKEKKRKNELLVIFPWEIQFVSFQQKLYTQSFGC